MLAKQRGLTFSGFLFGAVILILVSIGGLKLIPVYMNDAKIKNIFVAIANDPEMQRAAPHDIRMSFSNRAAIDSLKTIQPDDIEITKSGERLVLSANYSVTVPLAGNASLLLEFSPSSAK
jgi:hypothetical protein